GKAAFEVAVVLLRLRELSLLVEVSLQKLGRLGEHELLLRCSYISLSLLKFSTKLVFDIGPFRLVTRSNIRQQIDLHLLGEAHAVQAALEIDCFAMEVCRQHNQGDHCRQSNDGKDGNKNRKASMQAHGGALRVYRPTSPAIGS